MLAVGSATTVGDQLGAATQPAFPFRMVEALHAALPNVAFGLTLRGGRGMTAEDMLPLLKAALGAQHHASCCGRPEQSRRCGDWIRTDCRRRCRRASTDARDAGADVVLIDLAVQPVPARQCRPRPIRDALQQVAAMPGVVLFRRFDVMQSWAEDGGIDLERASREDRAHTMALLNACLGETLARFVLTGAGVTAR